MHCALRWLPALLYSAVLLPSSVCAHFALSSPSRFAQAVVCFLALVDADYSEVFKCACEGEDYCSSVQFDGILLGIKSEQVGPQRRATAQQLALVSALMGAHTVCMPCVVASGEAGGARQRRGYSTGLGL